jgi:hypothetical protein
MTGVFGVQNIILWVSQNDYATILFYGITPCSMEHNELRNNMERID